jgi:hypothetical protein
VAGYCLPVNGCFVTGVPSIGLGSPVASALASPEAAEGAGVPVVDSGGVVWFSVGTSGGVVVGATEGAMVVAIVVATVGATANAAVVVGAGVLVSVVASPSRVVHAATITQANPKKSNERRRACVFVSGTTGVLLMYRTVLSG